MPTNTSPTFWRAPLGGVALASLLFGPLYGVATESHSFKFQFAPGKVARGYVQVLPTDTYSEARGYGFDLGSVVTAVDRGGGKPLRAGFCTSDRSFFFSVKLPEGNYNITVTFGDQLGATTNTVKAESRRLMLENVVTWRGKFVTRTFTVNIRTPRIAAGGEVRLKAREKGPPLVLHWDDKLTLEFNGARPCVCALEIAPTDKAVTVYLAGDSTVTDQTKEPWNSWGQMLPRFFKPGVAVANHAESGETLRAFRGERRVGKIFSTLKTNDYLFIQFGHNDMKERGEGVGAFTTYKADLKLLIAETRQRGGIPVLVTSMHRKAFNPDGTVTNTLRDYPEAARQTAKEEHVALIDLHAVSKTLYEALGPQVIDKAFQDGTHHNNYGSYELAKCVVRGIRQNKLGLAKYLVRDVPPFDPAQPDPAESFTVPPSPTSTNAKPEGS